MSHREAIAKRLRENKPYIGQSSINTYTSLIANLYTNMDQEGSPLEFFNKNYRKVTKYIQDHYTSASGIKTRMAALISYCSNENAIDFYREVMNENMAKQKEIYRSQKLTPAEKKNWIDYTEIEETLDLLKRKTNALFKGVSSENIQMAKLQEAQQYIILCLYVLIPPRRLMDYTEMMCKNYDPETDNFIERTQPWHFVFNKFKTAKSKGRQEISIPDRLKEVLKKWIKISGKHSDYLLFDRNGNKLTVSQLQHRINGIFSGRKISVNVIRHSYLTHRFGDEEKIAEKEQLAEQMGHSIGQQSEYVKIVEK